MAHLTCNFFAKSLMRTVDITVILPTDKVVFDNPSYEIPKTFKTLYLLHGIFGSTSDWIHGTRIETWAQERNLAVVMPSGENKFYVNHPYSGDNFSTFIGEELVEFTRRSFPLSTKREDTYIGGLSMGGYGALVNGLKYHKTFSKIIALSPALILDTVFESSYDDTGLFRNRHYYESIFGDLDQLKGSDKDYCALLERLETKDIPDIYMACGTEDYLIYDSNIAFHTYLDEHHVDHTFITGPGGHDWIFWDTYILKALNWLNLTTNEKGINSGNVELERG